MNIRTFENDEDFYHLNPPWPYENSNAILRCFRLKESLDTIANELRKLDELNEEVTVEEELDRETVSEFELSIHLLTESLEEFLYCFPELFHEEDWIGSLWQAVASAYWRSEDDVFVDNHAQAYYYLATISNFAIDGRVPDPNQKLSRYLEHRGQIGGSNTPMLMILKKISTKQRTSSL